MAVRQILTTWKEQPTERQTLSAEGEKGFERAFKDTYAHLKAFLDGIENGDKLSDDSDNVVTVAQLSRCAGDMGVLTLSFVPYSETSDGEVVTQNALDETWTLKSVRNDKSLLAYCGASVGANPQRVDVEAWLKEPDGSVASRDTYKKSDETEATLSDATKALIAKYKAGHESVMRFYPLLTKTRTYSKMPTSVYENLAQIDTPSVSDETKAKKPGNLTRIISVHSWLKCQDDLEKTADGKFRRVESWMGAKSDVESWDENFYGTANRWGFPYQAS